MAAGRYRQRWADALVLLPLAVGWLALSPVAAGPVVCSTSLEAPQPGGGPVEVTRCGPVIRTSELVERRFHSFTAPFARGVDITHQLTDLLGIAMGGGDGRTLVGLGFLDQTIVWDGSALEATTRVLLEAQSTPLPWRSPDRGNGFCQGLPAAGCVIPGSQPPAWPQAGSTLIRGLW